MRKLIGLCVLVSFLGSASGQSAREELTEYLEKYSDGEKLSAESWLIQTNGDTISFSKYDGKWVLIDYWSVSCRPCIKEMPAMNDFSQNHGIANLEVIAVSVGTDKERWEKLSPKRNVLFPSYYAGRSTKNDIFALNLSIQMDDEEAELITTLPRYSLIDPNGIIVERHLTSKPSSDNFESYIASLIIN